mgnify:CR=1 FL=1
MKLGIVGLPNVGKSTLFNAITKAGAEAANYPFCTIEPNVGVVTVPDKRLQVLHDIYNSKKTIYTTIEFCDIAGLVKGASKGEGLGNKFLGHIREVSAIVHVVRCFENDNIVHVNGRIDPLEDIEKINAELREYSPELAQRPMLVAANKCDLLGGDTAPLERLRSYVTGQGYEFFEISAATTQGTKQLMQIIAERLRHLPPVTIYEPEYVKPLQEAGDAEELKIEQHGDYWLVTGKWLVRLVNDVNFTDYESRMYFDRQLRKCGLFERLEAMGIQDGDTVSLEDYEFTYEK